MKWDPYLRVLQLVLRCAVSLTLLHPSPEESVHHKTVSWDKTIPPPGMRIKLHVCHFIFTIHTHWRSVLTFGIFSALTRFGLGRNRNAEHTLMCVSCNENTELFRQWVFISEGVAAFLPCFDWSLPILKRLFLGSIRYSQIGQQSLPRHGHIVFISRKVNSNLVQQRAIKAGFCGKDLLEMNQ